MKLGPIQKEWIKSLRENPHRQMGNKLGVLCSNSDSYKACCLGEGLMVLHSLGIIPSPLKNSVIISESLLSTSTEEIFEFKLLGLRGTSGDLERGVFLTHFGIEPDGECNKEVRSLAEMNDSGVTWTQIADYIENNPENVFNESV